MNSTSGKPSEPTAERLQRVLATKGWSICNVLRTVVTLRKLYEIAEKERSPNVTLNAQLKFYLSIPLHAVLQGAPAQAFLDEVKTLLREHIASANSGKELPQTTTKKLGDLVSFGRFRELLTEFMAQHPELRAAATEMKSQAQWIAFLVGYIQLVSEFPSRLRIQPGGPKIEIEAQLDAPLVPDDQPDHLAWDWRFMLDDTPDTITIHLRHSLKLDTLLENYQASIDTSGVREN